MSNNRTGQDNNWDDELDIEQGGYDTDDSRPRRRRMPPEQPPQRRPRPTTESRQPPTQRPRRTTDFDQSQRAQRPRPTSDLEYEQDYPQDAQRRRTYTDAQQQGRPRSNSDRTEGLDRTQRQRPPTEYDVPQSPRPRPNTGSQSRQTQTRRRPRSSTSYQRERRPRRTWPWLVFGCLGGILLVVIGIGIAAYLAVRSSTGGGINIGGIGIGNTSTYTQHNAQPVQISNISQLQIHNQIGDVTITVDPNTSTPLVSTTKKVKAGSQSDANSQFNSIAVQIQPAGTPATTLAVNASVPNNNSIFGNHNDSVDIVITLPPGVNTSSTPVVLNGGSPTSNITSVGNVTISGLNGTLNVKNDIGNITVQNAMLSPGSTLGTGTGNVTFNGALDTASGSSSNQSIYTIQSEAGNLDVTLPANINVTLDAYTNAGNITTDFNLSQIKQQDGSYNGPMVYGTQPNALLKLHVSSGNVALHKA
ncbi:MAG TPA: hypothetical protein VKU38_02120 [Ktedonobacteraceae bacterium]|nr:hypothetical protein [Ktedonobacteraceae bacterium]